VGIELLLSLPRDSTSVPLTRRVVAAALDSLGTTPECRYDIQLAIAEACNNAVRHAEPADTFDVSIVFDDVACTIEVTDSGRGFDLDAIAAPANGAESGRGLRIIRLLTDRFELKRRVGGGTVVRFVKRLSWTRALGPLGG
jgi:serine/threonine-protein kinase RsbW